MSILIRGWKMEDWEELVKMARIGANNAMLGINTVVEELPPHGDLIDRDAYQYSGDLMDEPVIIPAEEETT